VAPLWLRGIRGKKRTPSVGCEVPMRSLRLARKRSEGTPVVEDHLQVRLCRIRYSQLSLSKCNKLNCIYMFLETPKSVMEFDIESIRHCKF
jgi:hypothetical protein